MILGIGTDITHIDRFLNSKSYMDSLANKILTDFELNEYNNLEKDYESYLAKKWSAKEAISKAIGSGIVRDTTWKNIEIRHNTTGKPIVCFLNSLKVKMEVLEAKCHLSISDNKNTVVAYALLEYNSEPKSEI